MASKEEPLLLELVYTILGLVSSLEEAVRRGQYSKTLHMACARPGQGE